MKNSTVFHPFFRLKATKTQSSKGFTSVPQNLRSLDPLLRNFSFLKLILKPAANRFVIKFQTQVSYCNARN